MMARSAVISALIDYSVEDFENLTAALKVQDREILELHYRQGMSWAQLEALLHYEPRGMKRRAARALRQVESIIFPA